MRDEQDARLVLEDGRLLFAKGDTTDVAYLILEGQVETYLSQDGASGEVILSQLGPGEIVGQLAMLEGSAQSASARVRGKTALRPLDRAFFQQQLGGTVPAVQPAAVVPARPSPAPSDDSLDGLLPWNDNTKDVIAAFQPDALEIEHNPFPAIARFGAYAIILFIAGMVTWASIAVIETSVSTRGVTAPASANFRVQAAEAGIIETLHVTEGQIVTVGDPLVTFDETAIRDNIIASEARRDNLIGFLTRLELEFDNNMAPVEDLPVFSDDAFDDGHQRDLYASRQNEYFSRLQSFESNLESLVVQSTSISEDLDLARAQLALLRDLEAAYSELVANEVMSRTQLMSVTFDRLGTEREINQLEGQLDQIDADSAATQSDREVYISSWFSTLTEDLLNTREALIQVEEELFTLRQRADNLDIHATTDAVVLDTHDFGNGSVIRAAETIIDLVPNHSEIIVRVDINPADISNITVGARVSIKLDALPFQKHGDLIGRVDFISEDTFEETLQGIAMPVYRARIHVEEDNLTDLPPDFRLIPGMNITGDIRTGERRIITYFIYPILRWIETSLRET